LSKEVSTGVKFVLFFTLSLCSVYSFSKTVISDDQIKQQMIQQSIADYPGNCPCPYSVARNGSSCGRRSAYSKVGGYQPLCYPNDVTPSMLVNHKRRSGL